ncbi:flavonoid 3',5'-hydroxylase 2-like [Dorcoceras hygrometricum]|uniref:Flavonoid 3',5'-hydroxylase 2-like n=1 Tax=Dorcoceras hygrometricum TaxID=472368 RepID=A0A2Z7BB72_9LAMI|nr:flavonoid 3',5'-hydroxylase 2-like [Dorcoceras hygrometricum]
MSSRLYVDCPNAKKPKAKADISSHLIRCNTDLRRASEPLCIDQMSTYVFELVIIQVLLAEPLGSLAFKMVQVRQLESGQKVKLESAAGWCVFAQGQRFPCHS